jgi:hypothetical protein
LDKDNQPIDINKKKKKDTPKNGKENGIFANLETEFLKMFYL